MNNSATKPSSNKPKISQNATHTNFIEALKSHSSGIAKGVASGIKDDLIGAMPNNMMDSLFGSNNSNQNTDAFNNQPFDFSEYLNSQETFAKKSQHERIKRIYEHSETEIFNRRNEEVKKKIEQIQIELKMLAKEVIALDQSTQSVISQEVKDPGIYHLNFFDKLIIFIRRLRKQVAESRHWAALNNHRKGHKSYFWQQASNKVGGTKFMLSQERSVQTQSG